MNAKLFFSADYRDGRARIGSKTYSAGYYCVHLLNQYYKDDTAARISVFTNRNWQLQEQLNAGYLNASDFAKAGDEICNIFHVLSWLKPFDALDIKAERNRVANLFTSENAEMLISYFRRRATVYWLEQAPPKYENYQEYFERYFAEKDEKYISWFLHYYEKELNTKARGFVNEYAMHK